MTVSLTPASRAREIRSALRTTFTVNGALTIGTLDGANVEMREEAGAENFFLFGLTAEEVERIKREGYRPADYVAGNPELRAVLEFIGSGDFSRGDAEVFRPLVDNLTQSDPFLVLADYAAYVARQEQVSTAWQDPDHWTRMSILNSARSGKFSSDRAIREYCEEIWNVQPVTVKSEDTPVGRVSSRRCGGRAYRRLRSRPRIGSSVIGTGSIRGCPRGSCGSASPTRPSPR
jgi:hypothetical protein